MTDQVLERFWDKVEVQPNGCWLWKGTKDKDGYGKFTIKYVTIRSHRFAYEVNKGQIPEGMQIDHLCRNHDCVNPDHMEVVSPRENTLRGDGLAAVNSKKTHCPKGHEYTSNNTYFWKGERYCKECVRTSSREYQRQKRRLESRF